MGQTPEEMSEKKLKPADFPAESTDKPRDLEGGEGLSKEFKETIKKTLNKSPKPKKP